MSLRFKVGQQVVCIHKGWWEELDKRITTPYGPAFNEIVTIRAHVCYNGFPGYCIWGYETNPETGNDVGFSDRWFEPLIDDKTLEAELSTIKELAYDRM